MGRNRIPKEIHALTGTDKHNPEQKHFGSSALVAYKNVGSIRTPDCLRLTRVRNAFQETSQQLLAVKVLSSLDAPSFELGFRALEKWMRKDDEITQFDKTYDRTDPEQREQKKMLLKEHKQYWDEWVQMSAKFGLTPADRQKIAFPEEQPVDELEEIING